MPTLPIPRLVDDGIDDADARRLIDWIRWWRPLKATRQAALNFRHPWDIAARWNAERARWELRVRAGYVNAREVETPVLDEGDRPEDTKWRAASRAWLSEGAWIPVPRRLMRGLGVDASPGADPEPVPPYFLALGVLPAESATTTADAFGLTTNLGGSLTERAEARKLLAVDIVLTQPRARLETVTETGPGGRETLVVSLSVPGDAETVPRIALRREAYTADPAPGGLAELLAAGETDDGLDTLRLGTLYFLSPPGATRLEPDATWQAVPKNEVFWNLNHAAAVEVRAFPPLRLSLGAAGALAGGLAQGIIEQQLGAIAAADAAAAAVLSRGSVAGRFWSV